MAQTETIVKEHASWNMHCQWTIHRFRDPDGEIARMSKAGASYEELIAKAGKNFLGREVFERNVALNEGLQYLIDTITGIQGSPVLWDHTNARVGVGNNTQAADAGDAGLLGGSTAFAVMDTGYPQRSGQIGKWRGSFGDGQAEFAWEEYTVDNGSGSDKNLNRYVTSKGTKGSGETWTLEVDITFS